MKQKCVKSFSMAQALTYLLVIVVFILSRDIFKSNYIAAGILFLTAGFFLSWFIKGKKSKIRQIWVNTGCISIIFLGVYKILKSSFLFEDIFFLVLESILILQVVISFTSYLSRNLKCIQILSLVAFMCLPLFSDTSGLIYRVVSVLYLLIWGLIIKIQILSKNKTLSFSALPSYFVYLLSLCLILAATNITRKNIVFNILPKKGYALETKKFDTPNKLHDLQASLFEITVISVDESPEDRKEIMQNVTSLFQESPGIGEFEKANTIVGYFLQKHGPANIPGIHGVPGDDGLIDPFKRPGSGIEPWGNDAGIAQKKRDKPPGNKSNQSVSVLKKYINLKTDFKNKTARDNILDKVTSKDKTLKTKIRTLLNLNKIARASTQKNMNDGISLLNKNIKTLPLDSQTREELSKMISDLKRWKMYSIYNNLRDFLKEGLQNADKSKTALDSSKEYGTTKSLEQDSQLKKEVSDFIRKIEEAATALEVSELYKKMDGIKNVFNKAYPDKEDALEKSLKAILEVKMELNLMEDAGRLDKKPLAELASRNLETYKAMLFAPEIGEFLKKLKELEKQAKINNNSRIFFKSDNWQELTNSKIEMFYSKEKGEIKKTLKKSLLLEEGLKKIMKSIDDFFSQSRQDSSKKKKEILEKIQSLSTRGLISEDMTAKLKNRLNSLFKIVEAKNITLSLAEKKEKQSSCNYYEKIKELIELKITGDKALKKDFNDLLDRIMSSRSMRKTTILIKKLEDILNKAKPVSISSLVIKDMKEKLNKLKEVKNKSFLSENTLSLISNLSTLKDMNKEEKKQDLEKVINSLKQSVLRGESPDKDLMEKIEDILNETKPENLFSSMGETLKKAVSLPPSWQIIVFPEKIVLTKGKKAKVKVIGLYDNSIVKDLTGEADWTFENSSLVWIDSAGAINAISPGRSRAIVDYNGSKSFIVEIIVLEPLSREDTDLKKYLR